MFVPTHIAQVMTGDGTTSEEWVILLGENDDMQLLLHEDGQVEINTCPQALEPMYIGCPHCDNLIRQSVNVNCKCGWAICALPDEVVSKMADDKHLAKGIFTNVENPFIGGDYKFYRINELYWIELKPPTRYQCEGCKATFINRGDIACHIEKCDEYWKRPEMKYCTSCIHQEGKCKDRALTVWFPCKSWEFKGGEQ